MTFLKNKQKKKKSQFGNVRLKNNNYYLRKHSSQFLSHIFVSYIYFSTLLKHVKFSSSKMTTETVNWILEIVWSYLERFYLIRTWLILTHICSKVTNIYKEIFPPIKYRTVMNWLRWVWFAWQESIMKPYLVMKAAEINHSSLCNIVFSSYITLIFIHRVALPPRHFYTYLICPCNIPVR